MFFFSAPFQVCLSLIRERRVLLDRGYALVPCSSWSELLRELFHHHYEFGLTLISTDLVQRMIQSDSRWLAIFYKLSNSYNSLKCQKQTIPKQALTFRHIDIEKQFFPPCMSYLLSILRKNHRLSYQWRFNFSLFLKDIGLSVSDSLEFWKNEYSKSCSVGSKCQHSWQANHKKYTYSIRHMYGLEGSKRQRKSRSCFALQVCVLLPESFDKIEKMFLILILFIRIRS